MPRKNRHSSFNKSKQRTGKVNNDTKLVFPKYSDLNQENPVLIPIDPLKKSFKDKLKRISESNLFWGGGSAFALAACAFQMGGALKFSIFLFVIAWVLFTISIFNHNFFERLKPVYQIVANILILIFIGSMFGACWFGLHPAPTLLISEQSINRNEKPQRREPTFTEDIDAVSVTIGSSTQTIMIADLEKGKYHFFIGDVPALLYAESNKPYVDVEIYSPSQLLPVKLKHNQLLNRPSEWDMNSDENAVEVMNEKHQPVFQLYYKSPSEIFINGLFFNGYVPIIASETDGLVTTPDLEKLPYPIKPIFKYPSSEYSGQRR